MTSLKILIHAPQQQREAHCQHLNREEEGHHRLISFILNGFFIFYPYFPFPHITTLEHFLHHRIHPLPHFLRHFVLIQTPRQAHLKIFGGLSPSHSWINLSSSTMLWYYYIFNNGAWKSTANNIRKIKKYYFGISLACQKILWFSRNSIARQWISRRPYWKTLCQTHEGNLWCWRLFRNCWQRRRWTVLGQSQKELESWRQCIHHWSCLDFPVSWFEEAIAGKYKPYPPFVLNAKVLSGNEKTAKLWGRKRAKPNWKCIWVFWNIIWFNGANLAQSFRIPWKRNNSVVDFEQPLPLRRVNKENILLEFKGFVGKWQSHWRFIDFIEVHKRGNKNINFQQ